MCVLWQLLVLQVRDFACDDLSLDALQSLAELFPGALVATVFPGLPSVVRALGVAPSLPQHVMLVNSTMVALPPLNALALEAGELNRIVVDAAVQWQLTDLYQVRLSLSVPHSALQQRLARHTWFELLIRCC